MRSSSRVSDKISREYRRHPYNKKNLSFKNVRLRFLDIESINNPPALMSQKYHQKTEGGKIFLHERPSQIIVQVKINASAIVNDIQNAQKDIIETIIIPISWNF